MATSTPKSPVPSRLIGAKRASAEYGIRYTTFRRLIHQGAFPILRLGRALYIERADLEKWIESRKERAPVEAA